MTSFRRRPTQSKKIDVLKAECSTNGRHDRSDQLWGSGPKISHGGPSWWILPTVLAIVFIRAETMKLIWQVVN